MEENSVILISAVFLVAGFGKGVTGMGLPTFSMALLGMMMPTAAAAALMILPSLATNLAQCMGPNFRSLVRRFWPMWLVMALATIFSPFPGLGAADNLSRVALGAILVAYAVWGLVRPSLPDLSQGARFHGVVAGAVTGIVTATTGVFVMPMVPYLQCQQLQKDELIQALGLGFTVATIALAIRLGSVGAAPRVADTWVVAAILLAVFVGLWAGTALRKYLSPLVFQRLLYGVFLFLGSIMLWRSV
ncbi:MAG: sulfite exporter TauE/SafE family protein [Rhodocyclaceae bacterium]